MIRGSACDEHGHRFIARRGDSWVCVACENAGASNAARPYRKFRAPRRAIEANLDAWQRLNVKA